MEDVIGALADQQDELAALVESRDDSGLRGATRCPGWSAADVLLHLAQTNEAAAASVAGRLDDFRLGGVDAESTGDVDDLAAAAVAAERDEAPTAIRDRWLRSASAQVAAFEGADPHARVRWVAGEMAARTLASTRLSETWIHTVDVASAYGPLPAPTDRLWHVARLAWRTVPYAFARAGLDLSAPVTFELVAPDGGSWTFQPDGPTEPGNVLRGPATDLCEVAGQRADAADTALTAEGPEAADVLRLVRTFA
jgi:uncharacterized protein (TIGR03084 family)